VEGLVHISNLPQDYFHFDAPAHRLIGERTSICYRLGDSVKVIVARVDLDEKKIDFELVSEIKQHKEKAANAKKTHKKRQKK
jgi:ribonuclease R